MDKDKKSKPLVILTSILIIVVCILLLLTVLRHMQSGSLDTSKWKTYKTSSGITYNVPENSEEPAVHMNGESPETWVNLPNNFVLVIQEDISDYSVEFYKKINSDMGIVPSEIAYDNKQDHLYLRKLNGLKYSILIDTGDNQKAVVYIWHDISSTQSSAANSGLDGMPNPVGSINKDDPNMPMLKTVLKSFQFPK